MWYLNLIFVEDEITLQFDIYPYILLTVFLQCSVVVDLYLSQFETICHLQLLQILLEWSFRSHYRKDGVRMNVFWLKYVCGISSYSVHILLIGDGIMYSCTILEALCIDLWSFPVWRFNGRVITSWKEAKNLSIRPGSFIRLRWCTSTKLIQHPIVVEIKVSEL